MLNALKNSILILLFVLTSSILTPVNGQNPSIQEARTERGTCRSELNEIPSIPLILLLRESGELPVGCSHLNTDSKSYLLLHLRTRNIKKQDTTDRFKRNLYFHPFSTLGKTKYYVFALRKIIV